MIKQFQEQLRRKKIGMALFLNSSLHKQDPNIFYFTGVEVEFCILGIPSKGRPFLLVAGFEYERVRKDSRVRVVAIKKGKLFDQLRSYCKGIRKVGVNHTMISLSEHKMFRKELRKKFIDISRECMDARSVKTKEEIKIIEKSCSIAQKILKKMLKGFKKFKSELEVAEFLEAETRKNGCSLAFPPIVASGKHAGMPHYMPGKGKILKGFCVIDFGVKYRGYCSDITRTVYVGKPSQAEKEIYEEVLDVQKKSVKMCMGGGSISGVFDYALNVLGKRFPHGLGHGIGVEIHEWPNLKPGGKEKFLDGMVFTVEPGVYTKKYGIRIEDDVLIEKGKSVILTKLSKELIIV